jgi:6-phosphogluconolactonase (cycloisomerase 2 family)
MRHVLLQLTCLSTLLAACSGAPSDDSNDTASLAAELGRARGGAVFTQSNDASGNRVLAFSRAENGDLMPAGEYPTGGLGLGQGLGSQGAVAMTPDGRVVLAVDAGSNEISSFSVHGSTLKLRSHMPSGGVRPVSVAALGSLVYVVNQGEPANVVGFHLRPSGELVPIPGASQALSVANANPAQVGISAYGNAVVVSEKATNTLSVYSIVRHGALALRQQLASAGATPFGFAFTPHGDLVVSEAGTTSASSYRFDRHGELFNVSAAVSDLQTAPCWVAATPDSRFAYVANAASASISGYRVHHDGEIDLLNPDGVTGATGTGSRPLDLAVDADHHLFVLDAGTHAFVEFAIRHDGKLELEQTLPNLPATAAGIAAR